MHSEQISAPLVQKIEHTAMQNVMFCFTEHKKAGEKSPAFNFKRYISFLPLHIHGGFDHLAQLIHISFFNIFITYQPQISNLGIFDWDKA